MLSKEEVINQGFHIYMSCSMVRTAVAMLHHLEQIGFHTKMIVGKKYTIYIKEKETPYYNEEHDKVLALLEGV